jgi:hypothetical protein
MNYVHFSLSGGMNPVKNCGRVPTLMEVCEVEGEKYVSLDTSFCVAVVVSVVGPGIV